MKAQFSVSVKSYLTLSVVFNTLAPVVLCFTGEFAEDMPVEQELAYTNMTHFD